MTDINIIILSDILETVQDRMKVFAHRQSHTGFLLVPKSVTLYDLKRCNGRYFASFHPNQQLSGPATLNVLKL